MSGANISVADVKRLREETGSGMVDCKTALVETGGDYEKAKDYLRQKGLASVAKRAVPDWVCPLEDWINRDSIRRACIPASNGFGNALSVARHYAALIGNGVDGVRLLKKSTMAAATHWDAACEAVPGTGRRGLGYGLQGPDNAPETVFGHNGYGGSMGFADIRYGLAICIVRSRMGGPLPEKIVEIIRNRADATGAS